MHMSDALVSVPVAAATGVLSLTLLGTAIAKTQHAVRNGDAPAERIVPLMGAMGAFVFAAQLINFSIPGTGSSGHLVGGILLAALLGPWAALIVLASVLVIQCLIFADGGFLALGANLLNTAVLSCLVVYPLVFRPLMRHRSSPGRLVAASLLASVAALELGALAVALETEASGITALPLGRFLLFMLPIHLVIGLGEGLATAAVLGIVRRHRPELLEVCRHPSARTLRHPGRIPAGIGLAALLLAGSFSWIASSDPDGLEWSIDRTADAEALEPADNALHRTATAIQESTALMPDYDTSLAGLIGCGAVLLVVAGGSHLFRVRHKRP